MTIVINIETTENHNAKQRGYASFSQVLPLYIGTYLLGIYESKRGKRNLLF